MSQESALACELIIDKEVCGYVMRIAVGGEGEGSTELSDRTRNESEVSSRLNSGELNGVGMRKGRR